MALKLMGLGRARLALPGVGSPLRSSMLGTPLTLTLLLRESWDPVRDSIRPPIGIAPTEGAVEILLAAIGVLFGMMSEGKAILGSWRFLTGGADMIDDMFDSL